MDGQDDTDEKTTATTTTTNDDSRHAADADADAAEQKDNVGETRPHGAAAEEARPARGEGDVSNAAEEVAVTGADENETAAASKLASSLAEMSVSENTGEVETLASAEEAVLAASAAPEGSLATDATATTSAATTASPAVSASTAASLSMPALQKKFTSLSVNKQFLEKASPTLAAAAVPAINKTSSTQPSGRLVSSSPASRLTSAKLTTSVTKTPSSGWGQIASPGVGSPSNDPLPSMMISGGAANKGASSIASPKLVTALTSGSAARSTSPQKGSPGLRNASLAASGRSIASGGTASSGATSSKVPWATVRAENATKSALVNDFPTAAEAARAKLEAERKEKAAAAEAAARAEQTLQHLERFRGTSLGAGNHWDEMDDEDEMDEVVQFGDGTQYKVPVKKEDEPVSKEERFKDVGHDRSLPFSSSTQSSSSNNTTAAINSTTAAASRPTIATRPSANRDSHPPLHSPNNVHDIHGGPPKLYNSKAAQKMEIRPGGGISLETEVDRGYNQRGGSMFRKDREGGHAPAAAAAPPVRAWGPLAQRQASLNPDAPKPAAIVSPPVSQKGTSVASPTPAAASAQPLSKTLSEASNEPPAASPAARPSPANQSSSSISNRSAGGERALPPHLALQAAQSAAAAAMPTKSVPLETASISTMSPSAEVQATPYGARFGSAAAAARPTAAAAAAPSAMAPAQPNPPALTAENQKEEMLSAAERARKRRQEEEEKRLAEKERARAKAAAIEEKMRLAKEEEKRKKREEEEARQKKREAEAEERRRLEREAASSKQRALEQQQQQLQNQQRAAAERPALLSPSDEAVSWRKSGTAPLAAPGSGTAVGMMQAGASPNQSTFRDIRPTPVEYAASPVTLLQRPTRGTSGDPSSALSPTSGQRHVADVSLTRNGNAMVDAKTEPVRIPTGPRAAAGRPPPMEAGQQQPQVKMPGRGPRVEIIAPTDEGAAQHRAEEQKQREARQTHRSPPNKQPVGVLKTSTSPVHEEEEAETRSEVTFEGPPVWNRYKVKVGTAGPAPKLPRHILKAQTSRITDFREGNTPTAVDVLSWEPPIPNLSSRTLSRDDLFHPKKFRKGVVIAHVAMPKTVLQKKAGRRAGNHLQSESSPQFVVKVPTVKGAPPAETSKQQMASLSAEPTTPTKVSSSLRGRERDASSFANESGSFPNASSNTPSPVNFMSSSSGKRGASQVSLPISPLPPATSASASSVLPSPSQMTSTWGQTTLFNLDQGDSARLAADRDHIREVWAHPSNDSGKMQNSLKGIVDEFPDVAAQYNDVGISTADTHHSAPASRIYSPLVSPHDGKRSEAGGNGFTTSASSPAFAATGRMEGPSLSGKNGMGMAATTTTTSLEVGPTTATSKENGSRQAMARVFQSQPQQQSGQYPHQHQRDDRRSASSNAFSAYAYPSPIQETSSSSANFFNQQRAFGAHQQQNHSPHHHQQQQRYAQYENGGGYGVGGAAGGGIGYGSSYQRGMSHPPSLSLGMPTGPGSAASAGVYHSPQGPHRRQNQASPGSMRNPYPPQHQQQQLGSRSGTGTGNGDGSGNGNNRGTSGGPATSAASSDATSLMPSSTVW